MVNFSVMNLVFKSSLQFMLLAGSSFAYAQSNHTPWLLRSEKVVVKEKTQTLMVGNYAPNFIQQDSTSKEVHLSSFKGKYVLLDFWASWCGPCREENPNLIKAYNKYKGKNFIIIGVTRDVEKDRSKWLKAIAEDGLPWLQLSDFDQSASRLYNAVALPTNFLIDPAGKIIAMDLRGERLESVLEDALK